MLRSTTALTAVENKIPNVSNLVNKTEYNTKISKNEKKFTTDHNYDKYITFQVFNNLTAKQFTTRFARENLTSKSCIATFVKKKDFDNELKMLL